MKKYFSLLIAVLMISAIICGCSQNTDQPSNGSNPPVWREIEEKHFILANDREAKQYQDELR